MMKFLFCVLLFAGFLFIVSCSDEPNAVGINVLPSSDGISVDSVILYATYDTTFLSRQSGNGTELLLGRSQNIESRLLFQFTGVPTNRTTAVIDSATLTFNINYRFYDSSGILGFEMRRMNRTWSQSTFTWDSSTVSGTYSDTIDGAFLQAVTSLDSLLTIRMDSVVQRWFRAGNATPEGVIFLPSPSSNIVIGCNSPFDQFTSLYLNPKLVVHFHNGTDTVALTLGLRQRVFVSDGFITQQSGRLLLQSGIAWRSIVRFDSLAIPPKASVINATLELYADTTGSLHNSFSVDNLLAFLLRKNSFPFDDIALGVRCDPFYQDTRKTYRGDVRSIVQQWATHEPNYGFLLRASGELITLDRFTLYGVSVPDSLRPRLKIIYSVLP